MLCFFSSLFTRDESSAERVSGARKKAVWDLLIVLRARMANDVVFDDIWTVFFSFVTEFMDMEDSLVETQDFCYTAVLIDARLDWFGVGLYTGWC